MSLERLKEIVEESEHIVFFGGAGVSTESGIPDFRSSNGLYNQKLNRSFTPEQLVSHTFFMKYTQDFYDFYREKLVFQDAKPNDAHLSLAKLEDMGKLRAVITQNIDGLHQLAGSRNVLELHGSIHRNYCMKCHEFYDLDFIMKSKEIPVCTKCGGIVKPDVVLYEEGLDENIVNKAVLAISNAQTLIVGGTSLVVYPAAGLLQYFRGKHLVLINRSNTPYDDRAELVIRDKIGETLRQVVQ